MKLGIFFWIQCLSVSILTVTISKLSVVLDVRLLDVLNYSKCTISYFGCTGQTCLLWTPSYIFEHFYFTIQTRYAPAGSYRVKLTHKILRHPVSDCMNERPSLGVNKIQYLTRCHYIERCQAKYVLYQHRIHCTGTDPHACNSSITCAW